MALPFFSNLTKLLLLLFLIIILHTPTTKSQSPDSYYDSKCGTDVIASSTFKNNLDSLLGSLYSAVSDSAFSVVKVSGEVYGLILCRGDLSRAECQICLNNTIREIATYCPNGMSLDIWHDYCYLRYSNMSFFGVRDDLLYFISYVGNNPTQPQLFKDMLRKLMDSLIKKAVSGLSGMFAAGAVNYTSTDKIYGLVQCTGDITMDDCQWCLHKYNFSLFLNESDGAKLYGRNCYIRYELSPFYNTTAVYDLPSSPPPEISLAPVPPPADKASSSTGGKSKLWIIITAASLASLLCLSLLCFLWIKTRRRAREVNEEVHDDGQSILNVQTNEASIFLKSEDSTSEFSLYNFSQIADATNNFSPENKLGEGGFGPVYKGQLSKGLEIAAKRLSTYSGQGLMEFKNEIQLIAKLQHRNLVSLIGYCIEGEEKILIYEYMPNKSLDFFLFDQTRGALLDWSKRFHIIEGIAQGLLYLHKHSRLRIIHRDLKASNILLDQDMNAKISDFGMARIFASNETQANTSRVVGTYGYMSPEYAFEGVFSIKSDVFSFGVLLLEIASGKKNAGFHQYGSSLNLLGYTWELWNEGKWFEIIDTSLGDGYCRDEIMKCIHAALMCVQENPMDRPTMSNVITMLSSENSSFPIPKQPAFFNLRITTEAEETIDLGRTGSTVNNITITTPNGR